MVEWKRGYEMSAITLFATSLFFQDKYSICTFNLLYIDYFYYIYKLQGKKIVLFGQSTFNKCLTWKLHFYGEFKQINLVIKFWIFIHMYVCWNFIKPFMFFISSCIDNSNNGDNCYWNWAGIISNIGCRSWDWF